MGCGMRGRLWGTIEREKRIGIQIDKRVGRMRKRVMLAVGGMG